MTSGQAETREGEGRSGEMEIQEVTHSMWSITGFLRKRFGNGRGLGGRHGSGEIVMKGEKSLDRRGSVLVGGGDLEEGVLLDSGTLRITLQQPYNGRITLCSLYKLLQGQFPVHILVHLTEDLICPLLWCCLIFRHLHN